MTNIFKLTIIIFSFIIISCEDSNKPDKNSYFIKSEWKKGNQIRRGDMVEDLIRKKILIGKSKNDIITMLGKPDSSYTDVFNYDVDVGMKFVSKPWLYFLKIKFKNGIVKEALLLD